ncbi:ac55 [Artaxa digramma nucleopolyhedrovirus]|uniref:Ac55 n=1 Tax=Artaxa digramma nucleopolyhedrovirus TaxID=3070910 RepID=A0AAE6R7G5_9ABAC|nr:ac55 [Euproctis digramma nucleopolyhedrovirus]QHB21693.1 ac55 [Artaxa digramma nucleopolyhedrovirus]
MKENFAMSNCLNFKLKSVIDNTVETKIKKNLSHAKSLSEFYAKHKEDSNMVGRVTTYDVVGQRDYKKQFDEKQYKF